MWVWYLILWVSFFAVLSLIGLAVFRLVFGKIEAGDYLISKLLGVIVFFGLFWIIGYLHLLPLTEQVLGAGLTILTILALWYLWQKRVLIDWRSYLLAELLFVGLVVAFVVIRGFYPTVTDGEKPMEMMMLSSNMRATTLPPEDAWLAGQTVNYYYFGYFVFASIAKIIGASSFLAFNFGLASTWALILILLGRLGWVLTGRRSATLLVPISYALMGNLDSLRQIVTKWGSSFDWWHPSRIIPKTITEFPAFSYLFADFHPHMIVAVWLGLLISLLHKAWGQKTTLLQGLLIGLVIGQVFVVSSWSILAAALLTVFALVQQPFSRSALLGGVLGAAMIILPYQLTTTSIWQGVALAGAVSPFGSWLTHWGLFLIGIGLFFLGRQAHRFTLTLLLVATVLIALPELWMIKDMYGYRFNTVFKLFWDAWLLLSIVAGIGFSWLWERRLLGKVVVTTIVLIGGLYLIFALPERLDHFRVWYGGDPARLTFKQIPELEKPYNLLLSQPGSRVYELPGRSFTTDAYLSAFTGTPTLIGWENHELLWRGKSVEINRRKELIDGNDLCQLSARLQQEFHFSYCYRGVGRLVEFGQ
ncbi:MAG: DUF2298 domain-containing protein [Patescibacteria group bacterium]